ncbi:hypothetical protein PUN28_000165 [Cardiocondyla obscurior]|uniref:Disks large-associated protein 5 n=1 Tax=Cardiocondyla obscurior TaxID=286306 RepID=A0AAW2GY64_9HYME
METPTFSNKYKKPSTSSGETEHIKLSVTTIQTTSRKEQRSRELEKNRSQELLYSTSPKDKCTSKLLEWRAEQKRKKEMDKLKKRPPFVVGIVRHKISSPISIFDASVSLNKKKKTIPEIRINSTNSTKIAQKNLTKAVQKCQLLKGPNPEGKKKVLTSFARRRSGRDFLLKKSIDSKVKPGTIEGKKKSRCSTLNGVKKIEKSKKPMFSLKSLNNIKNNVKQDVEQNKQLDPASQTSSLLSVPSASNVMEDPEDNKYTIEQFEDMLDTEKDRLQKMCKEWTKIKLQGKVAEDIRDQINQAVGQTHMLIKGKLKQFARLISCKKYNYKKYGVTYKDLLGFWDMMYIEIKDCNSRFAKLEKLCNYWQDQSFVTSIIFEKKIVTEKEMADKTSLESFIASDEKKELVKMQDNKNNISEINIINGDYVTPFKSNKRSLNNCRKSKMLNDEQFFETPKNIYTSTPFPNSSNKSSKVNASLILMKVSQYNTKLALKTPERTSGKKCKNTENNFKRNLVSTSDFNEDSIIIKSSEQLNNIEASISLLQKKNNFDETDSNENTCATEKSSSGFNNSVETVINNGQRTSIISLSTDINSIKIPTESEKSIKELSSNKFESFDDDVNHLKQPLVVNKIVIKSPTMPITNISRIHYNDSLTKVDETYITIRNVSCKMTPIIDQVSKKCDSSTKKTSDKSCSFLYTPKHQRNNQSGSVI